MNRRDFDRIAGLGVLTMQFIPAFSNSLLSHHETRRSSAVPLGLCNHSLWGMRLKAKKLIEFSIEHRLDSVLFNALQVFESFDEGHLAELKEFAVRSWMQSLRKRPLHML